MTLPNTLIAPSVAGESAAPPLPKPNLRVTAEGLTDCLRPHADRELLVLILGQVLEAKTEIRVLQATVNTLLIELCHRQPDNLTLTLNRMSSQRSQELLAQFKTEAGNFGRSGRVDGKSALQ